MESTRTTLNPVPSETMAIATILEAQTILNSSVLAALQSFELTGDRYDNELDAINLRIDALAILLERLTSSVSVLTDLLDVGDHSRNADIERHADDH